MAEPPRRYIEGKGWRYDTQHNMHRRLQDHDYSSRSIYMITISVEGRRPLLGSLRTGEQPQIIPTELGREVERCWHTIPQHYPEVELRAFQLMPDHIHGLLFVTKEMEAHLGHVIRGFKIGCSQAMWRLEDASKAAEASEGEGATATGERAATTPVGERAEPTATGERAATTPVGERAATTPVGERASKHPEGASCAPDYNPTNRTGKAGKRPPLFEPGYQDSVLMGKGQLEHMLRYIEDNPRRLAVKREHPELFRVVTALEIGGLQFASIGNRWLADRPTRLQVRCHNNTTPTNLQLIARQKAYFLERASKGAVIVSPCISAGEKEIARAILEAGYPLIVILENGFPPMYKPPGQYFEACAKGTLLMLAPWPYHMEKRTITRSQCLALNDMALALCTEPWTEEKERILIS